uniref:Uncharacterized protein n=1 Tax=Arundo donax TaxID=35708 RepID=A0A0A8Z0X8_ARUDO
MNNTLLRKGATILTIISVCTCMHLCDL